MYNIQCHSIRRLISQIVLSDFMLSAMYVVFTLNRHTFNFTRRMHCFSHVLLAMKQEFKTLNRPLALSSLLKLISLEHALHETCVHMLDQCPNKRHFLPCIFEDDPAVDNRRNHIEI